VTTDPTGSADLPGVATPLGDVLDLLVLEQSGPNCFVGRQPDGDRERIFGGQIAAQALMAAAMTTKGGLPRSLHAHFLRAGDATQPVTYDVDVAKDGRTIAVRRISAIQHGVRILEATASFDCGPQDAEGIIEYQRSMPVVASPESLTRLEDQLASYANEFDGWWVRARPFDIRYVTPPPRMALELPSTPNRGNQLWLRADGPVPLDSTMNCCLITWASDLTLLDPLMIAARRTSRGPGLVASLDHAIWFHRPVNFTDWVLYDQYSVSASGGRGVVAGAMFNRSGELVCIVNQEGYLGATP
jgi:acyl-CoA thioesterase-2